MSARWRVLPGDLRDVATLRQFPDNHFDALLCDPPYGLAGGPAATWDDVAKTGKKGGGFMNRTWDLAVPGVTFWREVLRVLKPGAGLLVFGGTRTYHRMVCAIEDAGFECRDMLLFLHAKGFPKSLDLAKQLDKVEGHWRGRAGEVATGNDALGGPNYTRTPKGGAITAAAAAAAAAAAGFGTALKPSVEPILLARKPLDGTVIENWAKWGCGALAIDACRIGYANDGDKAAAAAAQRLCHSHHGVGVGEFGLHGANAASSLDPYLEKQDLGRWPANVLLDESAAARLDAEVGNRKSGKVVTRNGGGGFILSGIGKGGSKGSGAKPDSGYEDDGGPSRFFFTAKVSTREREFGCENLPLKSAAECTDREDDEVALDSPRTGAGRTGGARNHHPTLKVIALTKWLATLLLPPPRTDGVPRRILVPFAGAASEMIGCVRAGFDDVVGIESDPAYREIAEARLRRWDEVPAHLEPEDVKGESSDAAQGSLFNRSGVA